MRDRAHENLVELLQQFLEEPAARAADEEIRAGERWLQAYPAPAPEARLLAALKAQMAGSALRRQRTLRLVRTALAAAAVIAIAWIGLFGPRPAHQPRVSYAAIIPAAVWESDDIAADDLDIVYFTAELRQIEAQMHALDAGEDETGEGGLDEYENELIAIETEFWKG
jgi:hypothetical protein